MKCDQCEGVMLKEFHADCPESLEQQWRCVWLCVDCGHTMDPITAAYDKRTP
jgi:hypothetical protein